MQREEKQIDNALDVMLSRVTELKNSVIHLLYKMDHESETLSWPTVLDNFALISSQLTAFNKCLGHDKVPPLQNLVVLPLLLNPDRDEDLLRMTEGRIPAFAHDVVPDYLRTKPEPEVEQKMMQLEHKAAGLSNETTQKQIAAYTKAINHILDIVAKAREDCESENVTRGGASQTSSLADTQTLAAAIAIGKGLKPMVPQGVQSPGMMVPPGNRPPGQGPPMNPNQPPQMGMMGKAPGTIKTNIKSAGQMHSYNR
ncbi:unnamed protein product [Bemisia tabaci]|uniref:Mediator of RNA polymerase II transcription subunit 8 n=1 Tax=Bemisia tabaci TaxID=7038 RepID=A0A9P0F251_BEMTA|nr:PREDICTED: mediator of RNA polymerase II transcription subunit 8 [Bemisia tabaci]XP_018898254.1 PREDICTED: mediator of RNA polymerase II transcription subunit 8 [Bemisia tabaci]XP_018898328.1 PREDICTED: mediator of RNA polymerase II transcription subunit 8 [Bemisia tabaci]CAH0385154.1 unnamed protein product [Bemisia tabaci]